MRFKRWNYFAGLLVLVGLVAVLVSGQSAWAQDGNSDSAVNGNTRFQSARGPQGEHGRPDGGLRGIVDPEVVKSAIAAALGITTEALEEAHRAGTTLEELAAQQGVSMDDVTAAAKAAAIAEVNAALAAEEITQEQADTLIERINNGELPLGPGGHRGPGGHGPRGEHGRPDDGLRGIVDPEVVKSAIAAALGITTEALEEAHRAGTTLEELAAQQGVSMDDVTTAAKAAAIAEVNDALANDEITQEQADTLIERINSSDFPLGPGGHRGPGGHGPRGEHGRPDDGLRGIVDPEVIKSAIAGALGITTEALEEAHRAGTTIEELAAQQGVSMDDVTAAAKAAAIAEVNAALAAEEITQEQADALIERINSSDFPLGPGGPGGHGPRGDHGGPDDGPRGIIDPEVVKSAIAAALGITTDELDEAHQAGTTLEELAAQQGVSMDDVTAAAKAAAIAEVNAALAAEEITQEQADALIERINSSDFPLGPGGHHGPGDPEQPTDDSSTDESGDGSTAARSETDTVAVFLPVVTR